MQAEAATTAPSGAAELIRNAAALIFDVDGTLAETEELHRRAFNHAFARHGLDWHWDRAAYKDLLRVTGGKERIRAFHSRQWTAPPLSDADIAELHRIKTAHYAELVETGCCPYDPVWRTCSPWPRRVASGSRLRPRPRTAISMRCSRGAGDALGCGF